MWRAFCKIPNSDRSSPLTLPPASIATRQTIQPISPHRTFIAPRNWRPRSPKLAFKTRGCSPSKVLSGARPDSTGRGKMKPSVRPSWSSWRWLNRSPPSEGPAPTWLPLPGGQDYRVSARKPSLIPDGPASPRIPGHGQIRNPGREENRHEAQVSAGVWHRHLHIGAAAEWPRSRTFRRQTRQDRKPLGDRHLYGRFPASTVTAAENGQSGADRHTGPRSEQCRYSCASLHSD